LRFVAAAPFLPAALFFTVVLRDDLAVDFELDDFEPAVRFALADDDLDEVELFLEPPLLLELFDEREPLDFLVVAMRIFPPIVFGMTMHKQRPAKCVPFICMY
jgi:hypothetical protein